MDLAGSYNGKKYLLTYKPHDICYPEIGSAAGFLVE